MKFTRVMSLLLAAGSASAALGQVVINEVYQNPLGSGSVDDVYEYIELYGTPGMSLDGYAIALAAGGADPDGDGIPGPLPAGWDPGDDLPEIDEAFYLDGMTIGANGLLVIYNTNSGGFSNIPALCEATTAKAAWKTRSVPSTDVGGRLKNDGSMTFVLMRRRPGHSMNGSQSVYAADYAWRKDINPDVDFNSRLDFGFETALPNVLGSNQAGAVILEPYQMVDDVAWSNSGGKEYSRSREQEINDTPGFQPDGVSRIAYYGTNPRRGNRINSQGVMEFTSMADEEFIYGESAAPVASLAYDFVAGLKGPTDQNPATRYNDQGQPDPQGEFLLDDINLHGFKLTPGRFNDVDSSGSGGINIQQFRFVPGDFNFDGRWDYKDYVLIQGMLGATLDDTAIFINDKNTVDTGDDETYTGWKWQGRDFQALLAMMAMDPADGPGGINANFVTASDIAAAFRCPSDFNGDGFVDPLDYNGFINAFEAGSMDADFNGDTFLDPLDYNGYINAFEAGC